MSSQPASTASRRQRRPAPASPTSRATAWHHQPTPTRSSGARILSGTVQEVGAAGGRVIGDDGLLYDFDRPDVAEEVELSRLAPGQRVVFRPRVVRSGPQAGQVRQV